MPPPEQEPQLLPPVHPCTPAYDFVVIDRSYIKGLANISPDRLLTPDASVILRTDAAHLEESYTLAEKWGLGDLRVISVVTYTTPRQLALLGQRLPSKK